MDKNSFITIFTFFVLLCLTNTAFGCTCGGSSVEQGFNTSYAVFTGRAIKIEFVKLQKPTSWIIDSKTQKIRFLDKLQLTEWELQKVTFEVIENFKEVRKDFTTGFSKTIDVLTEKAKGGNCGLQFEKGANYFVFGFQREPFLSKEDAKIPFENWTQEIILQSQADKLNESLPPYTTNVCSNTNLLEYAKEEVMKVRSFSKTTKSRGTSPR